MTDNKQNARSVSMSLRPDLSNESSIDTIDSDSVSVSSDKMSLCDTQQRPNTLTGKRKHKKKKDQVVLSTDGQEEIITYTERESGITYKVGDTVTIQHKKAGLPNSVCTILGFQAASRGHVHVHVKHYYRATEVPDSVYLPLVHDRNAETKPGVKLAIKDPIVRTRELFRSEVTDSYPASVLRGKCRVVHYEDIHQVEHFKILPDVFFYIFEYSPTTKRLATIQGEIRVGPSHQARLPEYHPNVKVSDMPERLDKWEHVTWKPTAVLDGDLVMYLRAARSMAAFAGMCDGGSTEDAFTAASMDETTIKALNMLHSTGYDTKKALGELVKRINPKSYERRWSEEDVKKFVKGLRSYGKNFFKIKKELLPNKETGELVEYYYYWKKTPAANSSRPHTRRRRQRKQANTPTRQTSNDDLDVSSASELSEGEDSELSDSCSSRDLSGYFCRHCYTNKSKDWHHGGKNNQLLCTECRVYYDKHGDNRPVDKGFLFKPVKEKRDLDTPESELSSAERKSPDSESVSSLSSNGERQDKNEDKAHLEKNPISKKFEETKPKQAERTTSPSESCISDSSSVFNEENANDGDVETNQEDATSTESSSPTDDDNKKPAPYLNGIPRPIPKPAQAAVNSRPMAPVQPKLVPPVASPHSLKPSLATGKTEIKTELCDTTGVSRIIKTEAGVEKVEVKASQPEANPIVGQGFQPVVSSSTGVLPLLSIKSEPMDTSTTMAAMDTSTTTVSMSMTSQSQFLHSVKTEPSDVKPVDLGVEQKHRPPMTRSPFSREQLRIPDRSGEHKLQTAHPHDRYAGQRPGMHPAHADRTRLNPHLPKDAREPSRGHLGDPLLGRHPDHRDPRDPYYNRGSGEGRDISDNPKDMRNALSHMHKDASSAPRDPRDVPPGSDKSPYDPRGVYRDPREQHRDPRDLRNIARDPTAECKHPRDLHRYANEHTRDVRDPYRQGIHNRDQLHALRDTHSPRREHLSTRESHSPHLSTRDMHSPRRDVMPRDAHSPRRDSLSWSRDTHSPRRDNPLPAHMAPMGKELATASQSVGLRASMAHAPHVPPGHPAVQSTQPGSLPRPPPLVSLPQTSVPTTQPPTVVASSHTHSAPLQPSHRPSHPPTHSAHHVSNPHNRHPVHGEIKQEPGTERDRPRSRSPIREPRSPLKRPMSPQAIESDSDSEPPRSPEPDARVVNTECHRSKNAIFIKHLSRGWNTCSRCDFQFKPKSDSTLARKRADPGRKLTSASSTSGHVKSEPRREDRRESERSLERPPSNHMKKTETPPENRSADAQVTSSLLHSPHVQTYPGSGRISPGRPQLPMGPHDRTPALTQLNQLSRYAMHNVDVKQAMMRADHAARGSRMQLAGMQEAAMREAAARGMAPYSLAGLPQHMMADPYRLAAMYPPGSRERLEWELDREKRERDARERELRERDLREMELREKMKHELEMKPPGFERLMPPGANHLEPYYAEMMKKYGSIPQHLSQGPGPLGPHHGHGIPGLYPPGLANELVARERDRLERLGLPTAHLADPAFAEKLAVERLQAERLAALSADPLLRLPPPGAGGPGGLPPGLQHQHTHSHTHLHLHQQDLHEAQLAAAAAAGHPSHHGHPLMDAARQSELMYRDMLSRPPYSNDPILAQQLAVQASAHQDQIQRQMMMDRERERMGAGLPPHLPP